MQKQYYNIIGVILILGFSFNANAKELTDNEMILIGKIKASLTKDAMDTTKNNCQKLSSAHLLLNQINKIKAHNDLKTNTKNEILLSIGTYELYCVTNEQKIEYVKSVILNGSNKKLLGHEMPMPDRKGLFNLNTGKLISNQEINLVSMYIANGLSGVGQSEFLSICSACHGSDGKGMKYVAPNLHRINWNKLIK